MADSLIQAWEHMQKQHAVQEVENCNEMTVQYGLSFTEGQIQNLMEQQRLALQKTGRIVIGEDIKKLILLFCDSPYLTQETYEETIAELLDSFYYFKNESSDWIADDELLMMMKRIFDGVAQGSLEYLAGLSWGDLERASRTDFNFDDSGKLGLLL